MRMSDWETRPLRIAFIMGKMHSGGKKTLAMQYFLHFDPEKVQVTFVCDDDSNAIPTEDIEAAGGFVELVPPYESIFRNVGTMREVLEKGRFDVVHAFNSTMNLFSLYAAEKAGVPMRVSESLSMAHRGEPKTALKLALRQFSRRHATHFVACGEDCGRWQFGDALWEGGEVAEFKTAIDSSKYAFDPVIRTAVRRELGIANDSLTVGFIGRFEYQKNPMFIIQVFRELVRLEPRARMILIGDGDYRDQMLKYISDEDMSDCVIYLGRREDIAGFYQAMDCFLLPSFYEGLPVVGLEAQVAGMHVLFSDEITREAAFCELGHFIALDAGAEYWARRIIEEIAYSAPRESREDECADAGFDATSEARRLESYYVKGLAEVGRIRG